MVRGWASTAQAHGDLRRVDARRTAPRWHMVMALLQQQLQRLVEPIDQRGVGHVAVQRIGHELVIDRVDRFSQACVRPAPTAPA